MGELVHHDHLRPPRLDRVDIHLFERDAAVVDLAQRHLFQVADPCQRVRPSMWLDETDDDVQSLAAQLVRVLQHLVGLAHSRSRADVHAQPGAAFFPGAREQ